MMSIANFNHHYRELHKLTQRYGTLIRKFEKEFNNTFVVTAGRVAFRPYKGRDWLILIDNVPWEECILEVKLEIGDCTRVLTELMNVKMNEMVARYSKEIV